jgi:hypothetical protein
LQRKAPTEKIEILSIACMIRGRYVTDVKMSCFVSLKYYIHF